MLLVIVVLKSLTELALAFVVARFLVGLLAGSNRQHNIFWQMLNLAARPPLWLTRRISPQLILDQHIPLAAVSWLTVVWIALVVAKIDWCVREGVSTCL
jgi:hypothetical protein